MGSAKFLFYTIFNEVNHGEIFKWHLMDCSNLRSESFQSTKLDTRGVFRRDMNFDLQTVYHGLGGRIGQVREYPVTGNARARGVVGFDAPVAPLGL